MKTRVAPVAAAHSVCLYVCACVHVHVWCGCLFGVFLESQPPSLWRNAKARGFTVGFLSQQRDLCLADILLLNTHNILDSAAVIVKQVLSVSCCLTSHCYFIECGICVTQTSALCYLPSNKECLLIYSTWMQLLLVYSAIQIHRDISAYCFCLWAWKVQCFPSSSLLHSFSAVPITIVL